jgi:hypothetical protein
MTKGRLQIKELKKAKKGRSEKRKRDDRKSNKKKIYGGETRQRQRTKTKR